MELLVLVVLLSLLAVAAQRWGVDSVEGVDSDEWQRRQAWRGFAHAR